MLMLARARSQTALAVSGALAGGATIGAFSPSSPARPTAQRAFEGLEARLAAYDQPEPDLAGYDQLIGGTR
jgi:hypothetical protein